MPGDTAARGRNRIELWKTLVITLQRRDSWIPLNALIPVSQDSQPGDQKWTFFGFICLLPDTVLAHYINKHVT